MAAQSSRGAVGLLKRGWNEIPEILGGTFIALIGVSFGLTALFIYNKKDGDHRRHKFDYVVVRPDDPIALTMRKD